MRIVFMGTPHAAVPTLRRIVADGHEVAAVWTQPDRPSGRGHKVTFSPVKEFALAQGLTIHQPQRIKTDEAKQLFASHDADVESEGRAVLDRDPAPVRRPVMSADGPMNDRPGARPVRFDREQARPAFSQRPFSVVVGTECQLFRRRSTGGFG